MMEGGSSANAEVLKAAAAALRRCCGCASACRRCRSLGARRRRGGGRAGVCGPAGCLATALAPRVEHRVVQVMLVDLLLRRRPRCAHHWGTALPGLFWLLHNDHLLLLRIARMTQAVWVIVSG